MTKQEIEKAIEELKQATLEMLEVSTQEDNIKLKKQKVQKRLSLARSEVNSIKF
jgi:predicted RNase H-like HicB family nuclease